MLSGVERGVVDGSEGADAAGDRMWLCVIAGMQRIFRGDFSVSPRQRTCKDLSGSGTQAAGPDRDAALDGSHICGNALDAACVRKRGDPLCIGCFPLLPTYLPEAVRRNDRRSGGIFSAAL